ncbi:transketolase [Ilumatobacter fluminis]|uniref:Transketolase n=1 Tax=Ilumatobacter fluminis TaxID=467091 RepID=A0A4R7I1D3_9ACTN|nr:transketolase [Ilumatobacter fluminis]TDT16396.1 transketolase [Ilumatobacter fluminis]
MPLTPELDRDAVNLIRGFAMDAPLAANSGHQGTAMALAPLAHVLYSRVMKFDPADPNWADRDRFVLSAGHASILQYSMLYLSGVGLELDDIKAFRQFESKTPGHPEAGHTAGVEVTTGPLGQGFANAVGMALAERILSEKFGTDAVDHHTFVVAGDGCLMEGVSHEAASLAGHLQLGKLVCVYDDNHITIDGETELAFSDDTPARFRAYGWDVVDLGEIANDLDALEAALEAAKQTDRPSLLVLRSHIGFPSPDHTDDHEAHGLAFDAGDVTRTKEVMGIPDEPFWAPSEVVDAYRGTAAERGTAARSAWEARAADTIESPEWAACWNQTGLDGWDADLPTYDQGDSVATRKAINAAFNATLDKIPGLVSGAADLTGNTGTKLNGQTTNAADAPGGRQIAYGVREQGMGSAMVGMALHGGVIPIGGTFFVFLDYMRPPVRLSALSHAKAVFVFTHDSVGVGEDGPTHQPVEHLATLRAIPDLHVIRPADANETIAAWADTVRHDGPTALVLSRQNITVVTDGSAVERGAGIVRSADDPDIVLVATGSEVALCVEAAERLAADGTTTQVVSMPSWDRFDQQDADYTDTVLPIGVPTLAVEAGVELGWHKYADDVVSIERFGASAPGNVVMEKLGLNVDHVVARAAELVELLAD